MQTKNPNFLYSMDLDDKGRLRNVFWADARSRAAYKLFGDAVTFITMYLTNKYYMSFASFVGVNHRGQSILLGCGLVSNEDINTFVWLFQSSLSCMSGRALAAIITEQCKAMRRAIEIVFMATHHWWCLWHIMMKILEKLRGFHEYEEIKRVLHSLRLTDGGGLRGLVWARMLTDYDLGRNDWLVGLREERTRWVPVYVKKTF